MARFALSLMSVLVLGLPVHAFADPFTYHEAISGDLVTSPPAPVFQLGLGTNTISGDIHLDTRLSPHDPDFVDFDAFAFEVPQDSRVTRITYDTSTTFIPPRQSSGGSVDYLLSEGNVAVNDANLALGGVATIPLFGDRSFRLFRSAMSLGPGIYAVQSPGASIAGTSQAWFVSYIWKLELVAGNPAPVPEPSTVILFAIGLVVMAWSARRARVPIP